MWPFHDPLWPKLEFFSKMVPVVNLSVKFDMNIFISDRYVAILLLRWFFCEMPIFLPFWEFFWGEGVDPLNVVGYVETPKRHILGRKHAFLRIDRADRSRNATWARAEQHFNHITPSFLYRTEHCSNSSKFLVREKKRGQISCTKILVRVSRTRNLDRVPSA